MALRDGRVGGWLVNPRDKADALKTSGEGEGGAGWMNAEMVGGDGGESRE